MIRAAIAGALVALVAACAPAAAHPSDEKTVVIEVRNSHFSLAALDVKAGDTVRLVVHNLDPIDHEFILGDDDVHRRHAEGVERVHHGDVSGEVSVAPRMEVSTVYLFDSPGQLLFACHLPGHFQYGMSGVVTVR